MPPPRHPPEHYAPWGRRAAAYLIDDLPALAATVVLGIVYVQFLGSAGVEYVRLIRTLMGGGGPAPVALDVSIPLLIVGCALWLLGLAWTVVNRWLRMGRTGQSLGKKLLGITLVSEQTGAPIGAMNALCRDLVHMLDGAAYVGYLWPLWDDKRQTFADMVMNTVVLPAAGPATPSTRRP